MKRLKHASEIFEADIMVKGPDYIIGYTGGLEVFSFRGVSDFSEFELLDGAEYDEIIVAAPDINVIAAELVKQELTSLDLQKQNEVIGAEMVKKDLAIYDLTMQNQVLGSMLSALELKIKANEGGTTNV